jgi:chromosome segregation protein
VQALEAERQAALEERVRTEKALAAARTTLDGIDAELRGYEHTRQQRDEQAIGQRERIAQRKLDQQALDIRAGQLTEAIAQAGFVLEDVINTLADDADASVWEKAVNDLDGKLRRLEPVNLAAIQEVQRLNRAVMPPLFLAAK